MALVRQYYNGGKPIAAICHGPQILAAADIIEGRRIAAWPEVEQEVADAGGIYTNEETVTDERFITGRWPADLPALMGKAMEVLGTDTTGVPSGMQADDVQRPAANDLLS